MTSSDQEILAQFMSATITGYRAAGIKNDNGADLYSTELAEIARYDALAAFREWQEACKGTVRNT